MLSQACEAYWCYLISSAYAINLQYVGILCFMIQLCNGFGEEVNDYTLRPFTLHKRSDFERLHSFGALFLPPLPSGNRLVPELLVILNSLEVICDSM
jgi:hypothetical protein